MISGGSPVQTLAAQVATVSDRPLASVAYDRFPDDELYVRIDESVPQHAVVVTATVSAEAHLEVLQLQDALREAGAETITTVLSYMGYARQDGAFEAGAPVSARAMARAISTGTDEVLLVNPHENDVQEFFTVPTTVVNAVPRLAAALPPGLVDPLFLAPDEDATALAATVRDAYGTGSVDACTKTRHSASEVTVRPAEQPVADRDVVLVDDIIATGSTMSEAVATLDTDGAHRVYAACVHGVLAGNAYTKLARAGVEAVYTTDSIEGPLTSVSVAPPVVEALSD